MGDRPLSRCKKISSRPGGHEVEAFAGAKVDQHPLLQVVTDNNLLAPYQPDGYRLYLSGNNTVDTLQGTQDVRRGYEGSYLSPR